MKRYLYLLILVAAILPQSCTKEGILPSETAEAADAPLFHATIPTVETTKVYTDGGHYLYWTEDDRISIFRSSVNEQYRYTGVTGADEGTFEKVSGTDPSAAYSRCYAIYPYSSDTGSASEGRFSIKFPSIQYYAEDSFGIGALTMAAVTDDIEDNQLEFSNVSGMLRVKAYGGLKISSITLKGNNGEKIAGNATLSFDSEDKPIVEMSDDATTQITLDCGEEGIATPVAQSSSITFWFALPPVTFTNGFTLEFIGPTGTKMTKKTSKSITIQRNHVKPMAACQFAPAIDRINGSDILYGNNLVGLITDKTTGLGIPDVPVTDGYNYCYTDENGVYQMKANKLCRFVYYSLPAAYETTMDDNNCPKFYTAVDLDLSVMNRYDFVLTPKTVDETNFTLIGIGDPQPYSASQAIRYKNETVTDIVSTLNTAQASSQFKNAYAITLGDIAGNAPSLYPSMKQYMSNVQLSSGRYVPFYQCPGNHDHTNGSSQYESISAFVNNFGPTDYSFNIGNAHIVVMDNYIATNWTGTTGGAYTCGITDVQLEWLKQDLDFVKDKENTLLIYCVHAPFWNAPGDTDHVNRNNHYDDMLKLFSEFHDAHILSGHTHRWRNYLITDYLCQSGRPIFDHNQNAACGWMWQYGQQAPDGSPQGYCIYDVRGNEVYNWVGKGTAFDLDCQMRVYDGNQIYVDSNSKKYSWYDKSITASYSNEILQGCFVVNVWAAEYTNWKLELFVGGVKVGDLSSVPSFIMDLCALAYRNNGQSSYCGNEKYEPQHYWYIPAPGGDPTAVENWEIRATQTVPSSYNHQNVYTCSKLTTDFSDF